jgi:predicted MFS family arabinose efflux permease
VSRPHGGSRPALRVGLLLAVMFMGSTLLTPLYPLYRREFGFSEVTLTLVYATYVIGNLVALLFLGRVSDQIGRRRVSVPAMSLGAIATLIFLFAPATPWLFVGRMLSGLAIGVAAAVAAAWAVELERDRTAATTMTTTANMAGIALGPLLAGLIASYAPAPLRTSFVVYLVLLVLIAWQVVKLPETVHQPLRWRDASYRPRIGVPREIRGQFVAPSVAGFATFALVGYYASLVPGLLAEELGIASPAISGAIVAALFASAAAVIVATRALTSRRALLGGLILLVPSAGLLLLAQTRASIIALWGATLVTAIALALGYRGTLEVVNAIAPDDQRAEVLASYMIACFLGNALPVIGVALLSKLAGATVAYVTFAALIAALASIGLATDNLQHVSRAIRRLAVRSRRVRSDQPQA